MEEIFGQAGLISKFHDKYEYRPGQIRMAEAVMAAFDKKHHLIVEAGTGTGKTLAYLVPAIAAAVGSGRRVIVSTGTKNLQEQLMEKDIPFLQKVLPKKFSAAYMKGRGNYACLHRIAKADSQPILEGLDEMDYFDEVRRWVGDSETGDRSELTALPEYLSFWPRINAKSETCLGQKCPEFEACFITKMRERAEDAHIVIVNHHLFFADLNVRGNQYGRVLPDYGAVVFDEAHLVEDIAADYFGFQVSSFQIEELARDAVNLSVPDALAVRDLTRISARVSAFADQFWLRFRTGRGEDGRFPLLPDLLFRRRGGETERTPLGEAFEALDSALGRLEAALDLFADEATEADSLLRRTRQTRFDLRFICSQDEQNFVYWLERRGRGTYLRASPIDVSGLLKDKLFDKVDTAVLTSATLSSNGRFDFVRRRLGLGDEGNTETLVAPTSFDYEKQAMLYLPKGLPDPRAGEFVQLAAGEIIKLLGVSGGHAFVLCTSISAMNALYEIVSARVDFPCFVQGSMSKAGIIAQFRTTPHAVLFATSSFWQGVDVQGDQLSCVIIDKLPFAVPSDPVVAARTRFIDENGGRSFFEYSVPNAIIALRQGIGRLIRSRTDRGVIAILDSRLRTKGYGREFLQSLPAAPITGDISDVAAFFDEIGQDSVDT